MDRFDQITTFVRVVELGGFAAAARDLGAAPSAVTTHIQALEQRLGARLLNRNTRHVKPTEVGEAYYKYCVDIINRLEQAESFVESMQEKPRGVLRLNTSMAIAYLVPPVIADYTSQFPEVSVRLIATGRHVDFVEEQFDVSIRNTMPDNSSLIVRKIAEFGFAVCVSPNYLAKRSRPQTPADLAGHNCILYTDSGLGNRWPFFRLARGSRGERKSPDQQSVGSLGRCAGWRRHCRIASFPGSRRSGRRPTDRAACGTYHLANADFSHLSPPGTGSHEDNHFRGYGCRSSAASSCSREIRAATSIKSPGARHGASRQRPQKDTQNAGAGSRGVERDARVHPRARRYSVGAVPVECRNAVENELDFSEPECAPRRDSSAACHRAGSQGRGPHLGRGAFDDRSQESGDAHCYGQSEYRERKLEHDEPPWLQAIRGSLDRLVPKRLEGMCCRQLVFLIGRCLNAVF